MKIDVMSNGKLLYSITGTDDFDPKDLVMVSKKLIEQATISADGFEAMVIKECGQTPTYQQAYFKAEEKHFEIFGHTKYSDYNSFREVKRRRKK